MALSARNRPIAVILGLMLAVSAGATEISYQRQTELLQMLRQDCGACHGLTLQGGLGPPLTPAALQGKPPAYLERSILEGHAGTPMPPWRGLLTEAEAKWLVQTLLRGVDEVR